MVDGDTHYVMAVCIVCVAAVSWRVVAAQCLVDLLLLGPLVQVSDLFQDESRK